MLNTPFKPLLFVMCVLVVIFVLPHMPASVTAALSAKSRSRNLFATAQNPSSFNKFLDST
jgi:hypothetical protein